MTAPARCAAHPGRPAVDRCPRCARPRCDADAQGPACTLCRELPAAGRGRGEAAGDLERTVRAVLAAQAVALLWGKVTSEYIGAPLFEYLSPAVLGVLCAGAAAAAAAVPDPRGPLAWKVRCIGVLAALVGVAYGVLDEGTHHPLSTSSQVLVPYAVAAAAAWLWSVPPGRVRARERG